MSKEKRIATSVDVLINVAKFEHIQITKYGERKITYDTQEEMIEKEDELTGELIEDILRTMKKIPEKLGKTTNAVVEIEEKIKKALPQWLNEGEEPNIADGIANLAKKTHNKNVAKQKDEQEQANGKANADIDAVLEENVSEEDIFGTKEENLF